MTIRRIHSGIPLAAALRKESQLVGTTQNIDEDAESQDLEDLRGNDDVEVTANSQAESSTMGVRNGVRDMPLGPKRRHKEIIEISDDEVEQPQQKKRRRSNTGSAEGPVHRNFLEARDWLANQYDPQASETLGVPHTDQQASRPDLRAAQSMPSERTDPNTGSEELTDSAIFSGYDPIYLEIGTLYTIVRMGTRVAQQVNVTSDRDQHWEVVELISLLHELKEFQIQSRALERVKNKSTAEHVESTEPKTVRYFLNKGDTYLIVAIDSHKISKGFLAEEESTWVEQELEAAIQDIQTLINLTNGTCTSSSAPPGRLPPPPDTTSNDREPSEPHHGILANTSVLQSHSVSAEAWPNRFNEQSSRVTQ